MGFGDFLKGAAGGALGGFAVGGLPGALIGGVGGGALGALGPDGKPIGQDERNERFRQQQIAAGQRDPFAIGQFNNANLDAGVQAGRDDLIRQLQQGAMGQGPSVATDQFNRSLESTSANQLAQAQSGVGNRALAARQAAQNIGGAAQGFAGQAAMQRVQEQLLARQQLGSVLDQAQNARFGASAFNANQQNQRLLQQAQLNQQGRNANDRFQLGLGGLETGNAGLQGSPSMGDQLLGLGGAMAGNKFGQIGGGGGLPSGPVGGAWTGQGPVGDKTIPPGLL